MHRQYNWGSAYRGTEGNDSPVSGVPERIVFEGTSAIYANRFGDMPGTGAEKLAAAGRRIEQQLFLIDPRSGSICFPTAGNTETNRCSILHAFAIKKLFFFGIVVRQWFYFLCRRFSKVNAGK